MAFYYSNSVQYLQTIFVLSLKISYAAVLFLTLNYFIHIPNVFYSSSCFVPSSFSCLHLTD
jgi:hypothetical protein